MSFPAPFKPDFLNWPPALPYDFPAGSAQRRYSLWYHSSAQKAYRAERGRAIRAAEADAYRAANAAAMGTARFDLNLRRGVHPAHAHRELYGEERDLHNSYRWLPDNKTVSDKGNYEDHAVHKQYHTGLDRVLGFRKKAGKFQNADHKYSRQSGKYLPAMSFKAWRDRERRERNSRKPYTPPKKRRYEYYPRY